MLAPSLNVIPSMDQGDRRRSRKGAGPMARREAIVPRPLIHDQENRSFQEQREDLQLYQFGHELHAVALTAPDVRAIACSLSARARWIGSSL